MQIGKMADYNLLLAPIPKDTGKSEPINQKKKLKTLFSPNLSRNFRDIFPEIFLAFRVWIKPAK